MGAGISCLVTELPETLSCIVFPATQSKLWLSFLLIHSGRQHVASHGLEPCWLSGNLEFSLQLLALAFTE